jgi:hypothetical protein
MSTRPRIRHLEDTIRSLPSRPKGSCSRGCRVRKPWKLWNFQRFLPRETSQTGQTPFHRVSVTMRGLAVGEQFLVSTLYHAHMVNMFMRVLRWWTEVRQTLFRSWGAVWGTPCGTNLQGAFHGPSPTTKFKVRLHSVTSFNVSSLLLGNDAHLDLAAALSSCGSPPSRVPTYCKLT